MAHVQRTADGGRRRVDRVQPLGWRGAVEAIAAVALPGLAPVPLEALEAGTIGHARGSRRDAVGRDAGAGFHGLRVSGGQALILTSRRRAAGPGPRAPVPAVVQRVGQLAASLGTSCTICAGAKLAG